MIIIDSDNYQASGIETFFFPGGEPHAKLPFFDEDVIFHAKVRTWTDAGFAACVISALQYQSCKSTIFMPYFPGARQDRTDGRAPFTVQIMHNLFSTGRPIHVFDPHSPAIWHGGSVFNCMMPEHLSNIPLRDDVVGIIAPDDGAVKRADNFRAVFYPKAKLIRCTKSRDSQTGQLSNYHMPELNGPGRYIVVDDICDGGGTFILLARAFVESGAWRESRLELFVSHGIFSKGTGDLRTYYDHITTTDSFADPNDHGLGVTVLPLLPDFLKELRGDH